MNALTRAVPQDAGLLLVGDVDQLPPAGAGRYHRIEAAGGSRR
ncbi:MAG: hypothetical protein ABW003_07935 [Microvirga sp.]